MKKILFIIISMAFVCTVFAACSDAKQQPAADSSEITDSSSSTVKPVAEKNYEDGTYTLMIYMCGSNLETKSGAATKNIAEMLSAKIPEKTRVIIQTGGARKWRM